MKAILFDMDGVITSERIYWNCAGLAIARIVEESEGRELPQNPNNRMELARVYLPDHFISAFKELGINSNWDITYAMSILYLMNRGARKPTRSQDLHREFIRGMKEREWHGFDYLKLLNETAGKEMYKRDDEFWEHMKGKFQLCYAELKGTEQPVIPLVDIRGALERLTKGGFHLGIVTGRDYDEARYPLEKWGLWDYFDPKLIVTEREVKEGEKAIGKRLSKPHPYPILRAIFGKESEKCGEWDLKQVAKEYVLIGDSVSDVIAAKNAGIPIICVGTGIASRESLLRAGADIVVEDLRRVPDVIEGISGMRNSKIVSQK
jgi:phosphoglycolate phosphatase-like HAD superfamily hydrolase